MSLDTVGLWAGFVLTLMILSYLLGDNFLYRLALYVFVGLTAGYVTLVTLENVIAPFLRATLLSGNPGAVIFGAVPLVFGALLLLKASNRLHPLGNLPLAYLIGVGAAVALVGAVAGTLLPLAGGVVEAVRAPAVSQVNSGTGGLAAPSLEGVGTGFLILLGVVCTLLYFQFLARRVPGALPGAPLGVGTQRGALVRVFGTVGQGVLAIALGAIYAGAILTGLTVLTERVAFMLTRLGGGF